jgi:hypothetical protein
MDWNFFRCDGCIAEFEEKDLNEKLDGEEWTRDEPTEEGWYKAILATKRKTMLYVQKEDGKMVASSYDLLMVSLYLVRWWSRLPVQFSPPPKKG